MNPEISSETIEMQPQRLTLRKGEKLRHRSLVDPIFSQGESLFAYPLRLCWRALSEEQLAESFRHDIPAAIGAMQLLITVPKKKRKHAVDRVLMRRRIREAYRLNRLPLKRAIEARQDIRSLSMAFIYIADKNEDYSLVDKRMRSLLNKLADKLGLEHFS